MVEERFSVGAASTVGAAARGSKNRWRKGKGGGEGEGEGKIMGSWEGVNAIWEWEWYSESKGEGSGGKFVMLFVANEAHHAVMIERHLQNGG